MHRLMITGVALLIQSATASAQAPDFNAIAHTIVTQSAEVQPGEVVLIRGSAESLEIFEALVAATVIAGGLPIPIVDFPAVRSGSHREIYVGQSSGVPTTDYADFIGADFEEMSGIFWRSVAISPDQHGDTGARIAHEMTAGTEVRLSSQNGTDLTFILSDEPVRVNTGRVSERTPETGPAEVFLPAGEFSACVDPASANGVLVAPVFTFRLRDEIIGLSLTFRNGVVTDMTYQSGGESLDTLEAPSLTLSLEAGGRPVIVEGMLR